VNRRPALAVRPDIAGLDPYVSPRLAARYRLNTNESPHPPPDSLVADVTRKLADVSFNRYPDNDATELIDAIADRNSWRPDGVWAANGSNEVLLHLFLAFGGPERTALVFAPTYSLHYSIPRIAGTRVDRSGRDEEFLIDLEAAAETIRRTRPDVVIMCSPNNPTGACEPLSTIRALAEAASGLVVVDEAYIEFAEESESAAPLLEQYANLVVVRTFSKAWRLAGVRIGYMLADPTLVSELARVRLPYHLSSITQAMGLAALERAPETLRAVSALVEERERVALELQAMGLRAYPSRANFVLYEVGDSDRVWRSLLGKGVLVRNYAGESSLALCLRVTIGLAHENDAFLGAMKKALVE
jgi:histidinol-phosphate aminotransferase